MRGRTHPGRDGRLPHGGRLVEFDETDGTFENEHRVEDDITSKFG
ncbi:hypothetical protein [Natronobacterium lacisalsi]|uniref:Uncharacterized protein n=1 Tax=Natronobacterium lacisalsi AJ5 TaxID=358396 RepID=M0LDD3_NATLA|nr:hypothetical protein C445_13952 [Halobiforma lacisalsi AJ5]